jgi:hypothetical protein
MMIRLNYDELLQAVSAYMRDNKLVPPEAILKGALYARPTADKDNKVEIFADIHVSLPKSPYRDRE